MNQQTLGEQATPAGDDEAVLLLDASLREVTALHAIFFYKRRLAKLSGDSSVDSAMESHRRAVQEHCRTYLGSTLKQRGDAALNKRTYELIEASKKLVAELRSSASKLQTTP